MVSKAAQRYAQAFLKIAIDQDQLDEILEDVHSIHQTIDDSRELRLFLKSPVINPVEKRKALISIFGDSVQPLTRRLLELVTEKGREDLLEQIMRSFITEHKKYAGIIDVKITSAMDLQDGLYEELINVLRDITDKQLNLDYIVKADLIGGMAVQIEDTVIDGTIKQKIDRLQRLFKNAAV